MRWAAATRCTRRAFRTWTRTCAPTTSPTPPSWAWSRRISSSSWAPTRASRPPSSTPGVCGHHVSPLSRTCSEPFPNQQKAAKRWHLGALAPFIAARRQDQQSCLRPYVSSAHHVCFRFCYAPRGPSTAVFLHGMRKCWLDGAEVVVIGQSREALLLMAQCLSAEYANAGWMARKWRSSGSATA